jgi:hypothetical protein
LSTPKLRNHPSLLFYVAILTFDTPPEEKERIGFLKIRTFVLVVCEGSKTEPNYFNSIKKSLPKSVLETIQVDIIGTGTNTLTVVDRTVEEVEKAIRVRNRKFDEVWVVIDRDSFPAQRFNNAVFRCQGLGYGCAWSNEAFELWYVLHFQYRNTGMSRDDYKGVITNEINNRIAQAENPSIRTFAYRKNDERMYALLQEFGDEVFATNNADRLLADFHNTRYSTHNPCTKVHKLVQSLNALKESEAEEE